MTNENKTTNKGKLLASFGALLGILSVTIIDNNHWSLAVSGIGVVLAIYGVTLILRAKKKK